MWCKCIIPIASILVLSLAVCIQFLYHHSLPDLPSLTADTWWGYGEPYTDETIHKFSVNISERSLQDLQLRLHLPLIQTPPLHGQAFSYGVNSEYMTRVVDYWKNTYNWRANEHYVNKYPHFITLIEGLNIHYVHIKQQKTELPIVPLVLLHGWPSTFLNFYQIIPILMELAHENGFVFEFVIPSLPGFGFSDAAVKPGLGTIEMSSVMKNLMKRLGYERFYVQGGEASMFIATNLGTLYPEHVLGIHLNSFSTMRLDTHIRSTVAQVCPSCVMPQRDHWKWLPSEKIISYLFQDYGYVHIGATKPDTVGTALANSPVGLAAYILEKFSTWTNQENMQKEDGGLDEFSLDYLLTNIMIYWFTQTITTSQRLYAETFTKQAFPKLLKLDEVGCHVPTGFVAFRHEPIIDPVDTLKSKYTNIVQYSDVHKGGHFAAVEEPRVFTKNIFTFIQKVLKIK